MQNFILFSILFCVFGCGQFLPKQNDTEDEKKQIVEDVGPVKTEQAPQTETQIAEEFTSVELDKELTKYCQGKIEPSFKKYNWGPSHCDSFKWLHFRKSVKGDPLMWYVFGDEKKRTSKTNTTVILCTVHGDEIVPTKFCFDILNHLKQNPEIVQDDDLVIVAPIVNPDSFFIKRPTRTNANGVDVNRNFPTRDWERDALRLWKNRYGKDKRRFPGNKYMSEPETIFQVNLLMRYRPKKVISVHAPLTLLDYDGPANNELHTKKEKVEQHKARELLVQMSEKAAGYKVINYPYFPGSLGNFAGNELRIPTYTLELPNTDWTKTDQFWQQFKSAIVYAIQHNFRTPAQDQQQ